MCAGWWTGSTWNGPATLVSGPTPPDAGTDLGWRTLVCRDGPEPLASAGPTVGLAHGTGDVPVVLDLLLLLV
jgi:hypothetical protein